MSTQYTARLIYGFPAEREVEGVYLEEWLSRNFRLCSDLRAGHYERNAQQFVGVVLSEVSNYTYKQPWAIVDGTFPVADEAVKAIWEARAALLALDPALVLGETTIYLMGEAG